MNRLLFTLASLATAAIGCWLLAVSMTILPVRDPTHVAMWRGIALALLAYAALSGAFLVAGARAAWLRPAVGLASFAAVAFGAYLLASMAKSSEGHFEGYLVVMGVVLLTHGLIGAVVAARSPRQPGNPGPAGMRSG